MERGAVNITILRFFVGACQLKPTGLPKAGREGSVRTCFPTIVNNVIHTVDVLFTVLY